MALFDWYDVYQIRGPQAVGLSRTQCSQSALRILQFPIIVLRVPKVNNTPDGGKILMDFNGFLMDFNRF